MLSDSDKVDLNISLETKIYNSSIGMSNEIELEEQEYIVPKVLSPYPGAWADLSSFEKSQKGKETKKSEQKIVMPKI